MKRLLPASILVLSTWLAAGCGSRSAETQKGAAPEAAASAASDEIVLPEGSLKLREIRVEAVANRHERWDELEAPGKVETDPNRVSHVLTPVPGRVQEVLVRLGDTVQAGQALVTVESPEVAAAAAAYRQAQAELRRAQSALTKAGRDLGRIRDLFEHRAAAQRDVWAAENELSQSQAALDQAEAEEEEARRRLEVLGVKPGESARTLPVRAPLSGKVLEISVAPGEYRNDTSTSLMTIADLSRVWITSNVPENQIRLIQVGEAVEVELTAYPGEVIRGTVKRIADTVDPETRSVKVQAELDNADGRFRPGLFGRIRHFHGARSVPAVPVAAVLRDEAGSYVFVETGPGRFRKRRIQTGPQKNGWMPVTDGLQPGERVAVDGALLLKGSEGTWR